MKKYRIKTKFVFEGEFIVSADNKTQAKEFVRLHCAMTESCGIHSSIDVDWEFPLHAEKIIK